MNNKEHLKVFTNVFIGFLLCFIMVFGLSKCEEAFPAPSFAKEVKK